MRSGHCRLRADEIIFLERGLPVQAHIDVLVEELARRSLDVYLSPAARALVERVAAREDLRDDGREAHADDRSLASRSTCGRSGQVDRAARYDRRAFLSASPHQRRGAVQRRAAPQSAHRLRHRYRTMKLLTGGVRRGGRAPLSDGERATKAPRRSITTISSASRAARSSSSRSRASKPCRRPPPAPRLPVHRHRWSSTASAAIAGKPRQAAGMVTGRPSGLR